MKIKYKSDLGFFDGLTKGNVYEVIEETETQYVMVNDLEGKSWVLKDKFDIQ